MNLGNFGFAEAIAFVAVVVAFYYGWQNSQLTKRLIAKENEEAKAKIKADLGANFVKVGKGWRLKIFNRGNASAFDVRLEVLDKDNNCLSQSDIDEKFPHERLDPHQGVDLIATLGLDSKRKHAFRLVWDDDFGRDNEKVVYPTA